MQGFKKFSGVMLAAVLFSAAASQAWAANLARLVIVHQGGRTQTMTLPDSGDRLAKAAGAACADAGVMFAFTEEPLPSASSWCWAMMRSTGSGRPICRPMRTP